ncbi:MAG: YihA family ribosome biogenesis GTP-binding protein [Ruminococcaceae bacterium]|nr:YihA family ribosome biogenesis GTP-binding protein [Oscillospiraceae bacterium]
MEMKFGDLNLHNTELVLTAGLDKQLIKAGLPQVAFSGRSNVGKSSLINSLLGRKKLARVSSEPGKTITVNYYCIDKKLSLVDLPGYGFARRSKTDIAKWSKLTAGYFEENSSLKLVLQLIDSRAGITADDRQMLDWLYHYDIPYMLVITKCDKLNKTELTKQVDKIINDPAVKPQTQCVLYSSLKGLGREALMNSIIEKVM